MRIIFACPEGAGKWRILFFAMLLHSKNFKFMLTSRGHSGKIPIAVQTTENGGIAQLARACGSYPQCPRFESRCRYQIKAQPFDCAFLWPVGQVVKTPPFHGGNMGSSPVRVTTPLRTSYCSQRLFSIRTKAVARFFRRSSLPAHPRLRRDSSRVSSVRKIAVRSMPEQLCNNACRGERRQSGRQSCSAVQTSPARY